MSNLNFANLKSKVTNIDNRVTSLDSQVTTTSTNLANHISSTSGAHTANAIVVTPISNFAATDTQAAIEELLLKINDHLTSITAHTANSIVTDDLLTISGSDVQTLLLGLEDLEVTNFNTVQSRIDNLSAGEIAAAPPVGRSFTNVQQGINVLDADIVALKDDVADHQTLINQMLDSLLNNGNSLQNEINTLQAQVNAMSLQISTLQSQVTTLQSQVASLQSNTP
jgi:chaperonin cofactor prefoldin